MVCANRLDEALLQPLPQTGVIGLGAHGGRADPLGPVGAAQMLDGEEQVLRAGLAHDGDAALTGVLQHIHSPGGVHVHDIERRAGHPGHARQPQDGFHRAPGRTGERVPLRGRVPRGQGIGHQGFDHVAVLAMRHHQHAVISGDAHGLEDVAVRQAQTPVIGREHLERGDAHLHQRGDFGGHALIEVRQVHVESVVDGRLLGPAPPDFDRVGESLRLLDDEVHHRGGTTEGRRLVAGVVIVRGDGVEHLQVEVRVRVDPAGEQQFAAHIHHFRCRGAQIPSDAGDALTLDEDVGLVGIRSGDQRAAAQQNA